MICYSNTKNSLEFAKGLRFGSTVANNMMASAILSAYCEAHNITDRDANGKADNVTVQQLSDYWNSIQETSHYKEFVKNNPKFTLVDKSDTSLRKGSIVTYNNKRYLVWNVNDSGKVQLISEDGTKFSGTPNTDKIKVHGGYQTTMYNNTEYIVTDKGNIYSGATGNIVYKSEDSSSKVQHDKIVLQAQKQAFWNKQYNEAKAAYKSISDNKGFDKAVAETTAEVGKETAKGTIDSMQDNSNPEFTKADKTLKEQLGGAPLKVVMASEHTDPAFHSREVCRIINEDQKLEPKDRKYHMLQIMTKHDGLPLLDMLELPIPKSVHFSITSLGGTKWEPGVMKMDDLLDRIEQFIKDGKLKAATTTVRIDPIIPGVTKLSDIEHIIDRSKKMGITNFKMSVMDSYSWDNESSNSYKVYEQMVKLGYDFDKYYKKYREGNYSQDALPEVMKTIYEEVDKLAQKYSVWVTTCGEKPADIATKKLGFATGCLSAEGVAKVLGVTTESVKQNTVEGKQRPNKCHCLNNKVDILKYDDSCASCCAYCYARHGSDIALKYYNEDGTLKDNPFTRTVRKEVSVSTEGYRKGDPQTHPDIDYVFTENAEAAGEISRLQTGVDNEHKEEFPYKGTPKINVSDMNGSNQAGIRTDSKGNISPNAYGIIVKKYQHNAEGRFVAKEGQFQDTEGDFTMFKSLNEHVLDKLKHSANSKIILPSQMALGKSALPLRFAEWLQSKLLEELGIESEIHKNERSDYEGYGLSIKGFDETKKLSNPIITNEESKPAFRITFDTSDGYGSRTYKNAGADATVALAMNFTTLGEKLTKKSVKQQGKQYIEVKLESREVTDKDVDEIVKGLNNVDAKTLNIAGNGIYSLTKLFTQQQLDDYVYELLYKVVNSPKLKNKIVSIRSGGQSGVDEAGAKAGKRLGIDTEVLMPKNGKYRTVDNIDIENSPEKSLARFGMTMEEFNNQPVAKREPIEVPEHSRSDVPYIEDSDTVQLTGEALRQSNAIYKCDREIDAKVRANRVSTVAYIFNTVFEILRKRKEEELQSLYDAETDPDTKAYWLDRKNRISEDNTVPEIIKSGIISLKTVSDETKKYFQNYASTHSSEKAINSAVEELKEGEVCDGFSDDEIRKFVTDRISAFNAVGENFNVLLMEAAPKISNLMQTSIKITFNSIQALSSDQQEDESEPEGPQNFASENEAQAKEDSSYKEGYQIKYRTVDPYTTLSAKIRKIYSSIVLRDANGYIQVDDLGTEKFADPNFVHTMLMIKLSECKTAEEMLEGVRQLAVRHPYLDDLADMMDPKDESFDPELVNSMYSLYRTKFQNLMIVKENGKSFLTINSTVSSAAIKTNLSRTISRGQQLADNPIYKIDEDTALVDIDKNNFKKNRENVSKIKNLFEAAVKDINEDSDSNVEEFIEARNDKNRRYSTKIATLMIQTLRNAGVDINPPEYAALVNGGIKGLRGVIDSLESLLSESSETEFAQQRADNAEIPFAKALNSKYTALAKTLAGSMTAGNRITVRHNKKQYSSYTPISYSERIMEILTGDDKNKIKEEFTKYRWFKINKDGKNVIRNMWIDLMVNGNERKAAVGVGSTRNYPKVVVGNAKSFKENFKIATLLTAEYDGEVKTYEELTPAELFMSAYTAFHKGSAKGFGYYCFPCLADSENLEMIQAPVLSLKDDYNGNIDTLRSDIISKGLMGPIMSEVDRIAVVWKRRKLMEKDPTVKPVAVWDKNGERFHFFPELNDAKTLDGKSTVLERLLSGGYNKNDSLLAADIIGAMTDILKSRFEEYKKLLKDEAGAIVSQEKKDKNGNVTDKEDVIKTVGEQAIPNSMASLEEFFLNDTLAQTNIVELFVTDPAFFKGAKDFVKRWKGVFTSTNRINTDAMYRNSNGVIEKVGHKTSNYILLADNIDLGTDIALQKKILKDKLDRGMITADWFNKIMDKLVNINVTDGQAIRTLTSFREITISSGKEWTPRMEDAYKKIMKGDWEQKDFDVVWQTIKPFIQTQTELDTKVELGGERIITKMPVQLKDSEALALYAMVTSGQNTESDNPTLRGLINYMENSKKDGKEGIDFAVFESGCKVGIQGVVDIQHRELTEKEKKEYRVSSYNDLRRKVTDQLATLFYEGGKSKPVTLPNGEVLKPGDPNAQNIVEKFLDSFLIKEEDIKSYLDKLTGGIGNYDRQIVHSLNNEDYGIVTATPEHMFDKLQGIGSQIAKLIMEDMQDEVIGFNGKGIYSFDFKKLFECVEAESRIQDAKELFDTLKTPEDISSLLQTSILGSAKYSNSLLNSVSVSNGKFVIPPYEALHTRQIQNICNAIVRSRVIHQKTIGGTAIQASCTYSENLKIKYSEDPVTGKERVEYVPCLLPWYMVSQMENLKNPDGTVDISRIDPSLMKAIGYRIPTEDKYSMMPLKIVGILPKCSGTQIILPKEITHLSGSDFDVDKMFMIFQDFEPSSHPKRDFINSIVENEELKERRRRIANKENEYHNKAFRLVSLESKFGKKKLSKEEFNNLVKDKYAEILKKEANTTPQKYYEDVIRKRLIELKEADRRAAEGRWLIYSENNKDKLPKVRINRVQYEDDAEDGKNGISIDEETGTVSLKSLKNMSAPQRRNLMFDLMYARLTGSDCAIKWVDPQGFDSLKELADSLRSIEGKRDALPVTHPYSLIESQHQNIIGKQLLAVYASQFAAHAVLQNNQPRLKDGLNITGVHQRTARLDSVLNNAGKLTSKILGSLGGAAADVAKDPILEALHQSLDTVGLTTTMLRMGYTEEDAIWFVANPEISKVYRMLRDSKYSKIEEHIRAELKELNKELESAYPDEKARKSMLMEYRLRREHGVMFERSQLKQFISNKGSMTTADKIMMLECLGEVLDVSKELRQVDTALRNDTVKSFGPTAADVALKTITVNDCIINYEKSLDKETLGGYATLEFDKPPIETIESDWNAKEVRDITYNSANPMESASYNCSYELYTHIFNNMFLENSGYVRVNFKKWKNNFGVVLTSDVISEVLEAYQAYSLTRCQGMLKQNEDGSYMNQEETRDWYINSYPKEFEEKQLNSANPFVRTLKISYDGKLKTISVDDLGMMLKEEIENLQRNYTALLSDDPELAQDLFRYMFYRYGLGFNPKGYRSLVTTEVQQSIKGYMSTLESMMNTENMDMFILQYIRNNPKSKFTKKFIKWDRHFDTAEGESAVELNKDTLRNLGLVVQENFKTGVIIARPVYFMAFGKKKLFIPVISRPHGKVVYQEFSVLHDEYEYGQPLDVIKSVYKEPVEDEKTVPSTYNAEALDQLDPSTIPVGYSNYREGASSVSNTTDLGTFNVSDIPYANNGGKELEKTLFNTGALSDPIDSVKAEGDINIGKEIVAENGEDMEALSKDYEAFYRDKEQIDKTIEETNALKSDVQEAAATLDKGKSLKSLGNDPEYFKDLNNTLYELASKYGMSIQRLNELETRMGVTGVTELSSTLDGLASVIRIAKGEQGERALPEEFAHFVFGVMLDSKNTLAARLIKHVIDNGLAPEVLGEDYQKYYELYNGDENLLAEEACGHLLRDGFVDMYRLSQPVSKPYFKIRNLIQRLWEAIKKYFGKADDKKFSTAADYARKEFGDLAKDILSGGKYDSVLMKGKITADRKLFAAGRSLSAVEKVVNRIAKNESLLIKIKSALIKRTDNELEKEAVSRSLVDRKAKLRALVEARTITEMKKGILVNMSDLIERLKNVNDNLPAISRYSLEARSHAMKSALNTINASNNTVKAVSQMLHEDSEDTAENRDLQAALKNVLDAVNAVSYNWNKLALDTYASYLESYAGGKTISFEMKGKPVEVNIREYLEYLPNDINFADYLFESMATSSDIILRLADTAVKERKELARLKTLDVQKEAIALGKEYMAAGGRDFEFMFEKDNEGHKTGNYISEFNWGKFYRDRKQYLREHKGVFNAAEVFTAANSKGDGLVDKYRNPAYQRMMENPAQKKFYTEFMRIYQDMQDLLPENSMGNAGVLAIQMRKDSSQRFDLKGDLTKVFPHLIMSFADNFVKRTDDNEFGVTFKMQDLNGEEYHQVPIFFNKYVSDADKNLNTDCVSTLIAFAGMANNYNEMTKIADMAEIGRQVLKNREVGITVGGKIVMSKLRAQGKDIEDKVVSNTNRASQKMDEFVKSQIYGIYKREGVEMPLWESKDKETGKVTVHTLNSEKSIDAACMLNSVCVLGFNFLSGLSSMFSDITQINAEAVAGQYFTMRELLKADREYAKGLKDMIADFGGRGVFHSKLTLFDEMFDCLQDQNEKQRNLNFTKGRFGRFFSRNLIFFAQHMGDHWGQSRTGIAQAIHYKLKDKYGKDTNLWEALTKEEVRKGHPELGMRLVLKEGTKFENGTLASLPAIVTELSGKIRGLNDHLFGIYNQHDMAVMQKFALGRALMMYKKYLVPAWERRWSRGSYNMDLKANTEGYLRTYGRFWWHYLKDLREMKFNIATNWNNLTVSEKQNMRRAITDNVTFVMLAIALTFMKRGFGGEFKKRPWLAKAAYYYMLRLRSEMGAMLPYPSTWLAGGGKWGPMLDVMQQLKSPIPALETIGGLQGAIGGLFMPQNWIGDHAEVQGGVYKGMPKGLKSLLSSPFCPTFSTINKEIKLPQSMFTFYE